MKSKISGKEVVVTSSLVALSGDKISLFPFSDDLSFELAFVFKYNEDSRPTVKINHDTNSKNRSEVVFVRPFTNSSFSNTSPLLFAADDDDSFDYYLNVAVTTIGTLDHHTTLVHFTILKEKG